MLVAGGHEILDALPSKNQRRPQRTEWVLRECLVKWGLSAMAVRRVCRASKLHCGLHGDMETPETPQQTRATWPCLGMLMVTGGRPITNKQANNLKLLVNNQLTELARWGAIALRMVGEKDSGVNAFPSHLPDFTTCW